MYDRQCVVVAIYAAMLGWFAHAWWRSEKENIAWEASRKARDAMEWDATFHRGEPQPVPAAVEPTATPA